VFPLHSHPSSWLNQVECWFSILSRNALRGASFTSVRQLCQAIDRFVEAHNPNAHPFEWSKQSYTPDRSDVITLTYDS